MRTFRKRNAETPHVGSQTDPEYVTEKDGDFVTEIGWVPYEHNEHNEHNEYNENAVTHVKFADVMSVWDATEDKPLSRRKYKQMSQTIAKSCGAVLPSTVPVREVGLESSGEGFWRRIREEDPQVAILIPKSKASTQAILWQSSRQEITRPEQIQEVVQWRRACEVAAVSYTHLRAHET